MQLLVGRLDEQLAASAELEEEMQHGSAGVGYAT